MDYNGRNHWAASLVLQMVYLVQHLSDSETIIGTGHVEGEKVGQIGIVNRRLGRSNVDQSLIELGVHVSHYR